MIEAGLTRDEWVQWVDAIVTLALENEANRQMLEQVRKGE